MESFPDLDLTTTTPAPPSSSVGPDVQRTVVFLEQHTVVGQDVFMLGGTDDMMSECVYYLNYFYFYYYYYLTNVSIPPSFSFQPALVTVVRQPVTLVPLP